jgi:hypothetical protein
MIVLTFRHGVTTDEWRFEGIDEPALRRMLQDLSLYASDGDGAVLTAVDANGAKVGSWTRAGAAHLASVMFRERTTPPWSEVEAAIQQAVMDPHPDEAAPA